MRRLRDWAVVTVWLLKYTASVEVVIEGLDNIPEGPCVFVSRHESFFDTLAFFLMSPNICYVMKKELRELPLYGSISEFAGMIFLNRGGGTGVLKKLKEEIVDRFAKGRHIVFFAQGTRNLPGEEGTYNPFIYSIYKNSEVPFIPVSLSTGIGWPKNWMIKPGAQLKIKLHPAMARGLTKDDFMSQMVYTIEVGSTELREG